MNTFKKSSYSSTVENCVEICHADDFMSIRDSKNPNSPILHFPPDAYRSFIARIIKETL
ncbi:DUF397 domain-containing protein [Streptomyces sp. NPDC051173]|uniref:DUF397 domain-containing protein n=1 Tax=Streptomyces sp. NPDC051173 TaxID=3155164 RepID=UPI00344EBB56